MSDIHIISLKDAKKYPDIAGNKANNISRLLAINRNFVIPNGFCISTHIYDRFINLNQIPIGDFNEEIKKLNYRNFSEIRLISKRIDILFQNGKFSKEMIKIIRNAYNHLSNNKVVVRSSATLEDQPDFSFAGIYESYINIIHVNDLLKAVKKCWISLWSTGAIYYRIKNKMFDQNKMAVIIQEMIEGNVSGILFTQNVINGEPKEMILNSSYGLCQGIVTNEVPIDTFVLSYKGEILESSLSIKSHYLKGNPKESGIIKEKTPSNQKKKSSLSDKQIIELAETGKQIATFFNSPQDIEWTFFNEKLIILQTRNISKINISNVNTKQKDTWSFIDNNDKIQSYVWTRDDGPPQRYNTCISPLSESILKTVIEDGLNLALKKLPLPQTSERIQLETFNSYLYWNVETRIKIKKSFRLLIFLYKLRKAIKFGLQEYNRFLESKEEDVSEYFSFRLNKMTDKQLSCTLEKVLSLEKEYFVYEVFIGLAGEVFLDIFVDIASKLTKLERLDIVQLLSGFENASTRLQLDLQSLYKRIRLSNRAEILFKENHFTEINDILSTSSNIDFQEINKLVEQIRKNFGHRRLKADWQYPSIGEDPSYILLVLQKWVIDGKIENPLIIDTLRRNEILAKCRLKIKRNPIKRWLFEKLWFAAQQWAPIHEERQHHLNYIDEIVRRHILEIGKRLRNKNIITENDDVFMLTLNDICNILLANKHKVDGSIIKRRKEKWIYHSSINPPPYISKKDHFKPNLYENVIRGLPGSPGNIFGVAKIILTLDEITDIEKIDILVTRTTNPSWTPIIGMSNGIVTDYGGVLSHSAIIAREFGIPAVVSTQIATSVLQNGQDIEIFGNQGIVKKRR